MMSRCQRRIVSGVTSSRSPWRQASGITPGSAASRVRSAQFSFGRHGCRRRRTASWWRRIKISAVFHVSSRRDSRGHPASRVIRRKMNRRHMIGDHHGRSVGRATLLVRAVDAILGTHNPETIERYHSKIYLWAECWHWLGSISSSGHGRLRCGTRAPDPSGPRHRSSPLTPTASSSPRPAAARPATGLLSNIRHRCDEASCRRPRTGSLVGGRLRRPQAGAGVTADRPARCGRPGCGGPGRDPRGSRAWRHPGTDRGGHLAGQRGRNPGRPSTPVLIARDPEHADRPATGARGARGLLLVPLPHISLRRSRTAASP